MELDPDRPSPARVAAVENAIRQAASERLSSNRSTGGGRRTSARTDLVPGLNDSFDNAVEAACLYELQYHRTSTAQPGLVRRITVPVSHTLRCVPEAGIRAQTEGHIFERDTSLPEWHGGHYGWHSFRRGLATNLHALGVDRKTIQAILRHRAMLDSR